MRRVGEALACLALVVGLVGASSSCHRKSSGKPGVAVSIFPLYDLARRVAGDRLDVVLVLPPGRSEHSYDPTPKEAARFADAKLGIQVGLEMDDWLKNIVEGAAGKGVTFLAIGPLVDPVPMSQEHVGEVEAAQEGSHADDDHEGTMDPHVWLDPVRMQKAVDGMVDAFAKLDPPGADEYKKRGAEVKASLAALDASIKTRAATWSRKTIVTFHGSMSYFARRYGLNIAAVIEPFPGKEPGPRYLEKVLEAVKTSNAAALFSEPQLEKTPAKVVADRSGVPLYELDPVGGTAGVDSYEKLLGHDTDVLEGALK